MKEAPFYIGQKVVCVDDSWWYYLKNGHEYTVLDVMLHKCGVGYEISVAIDTQVRRDTFRCGCKCDVNYMYASPRRFRAIDENTYENISKELAVLPQDEVPDVKQIKELV